MTASMPSRQATPAEPDDTAAAPARTGVIQVASEVTQGCNYRRLICDYRRILDPTTMPLEMARHFFVVFPLGQLGAVLITGGEPLLHPD